MEIMESKEKHNAGVEIGRCVFLFFFFEELKFSNDVPACQAGNVFARFCLTAMLLLPLFGL